MLEPSSKEIHCFGDLMWQARSPLTAGELRGGRVALTRLEQEISRVYISGEEDLDEESVDIGEFSHYVPHERTHDSDE